MRKEELRKLSNNELELLYADIENELDRRENVDDLRVEIKELEKELKENE